MIGFFESPIDFSHETVSKMSKKSNGIDSLEGVLMIIEIQSLVKSVGGNLVALDHFNLR